MSVIKKAIFPVAGLGTRFLPVTKASPKEMLPILDKPLIQYAVEEAIEAGIEEIIFVTNSAKRAIEDHFDRNFELENALREKKNVDALFQIQHLLPNHVRIVYTKQSEALGLGHAISCAKNLIGNEPFAVLLADDLMYSAGVNCLAQMVAAYKNKKVDGVLAIEQIAIEKTNQYGIVSIDSNYRTSGIVEKPAPENAPSNLAIVGRYILPPEIFFHLDNATPGVGNEIQLTDAIAKLLPTHHLLAFPFDGYRYDCGSKLGYAQANVDYLLRDPKLGATFKAWLSEKV